MVVGTMVLHLSPPWQIYRPTRHGLSRLLVRLGTTIRKAPGEDFAARPSYETSATSRPFIWVVKSACSTAPLP